MKKKILVTVLAAVLSLSMSVTSLAAGWQSDTKGTWYQNDDGSYPTNGWQWIDGNNDGTAECYYFDANGYMLANTTTPDGYQVNSDGAWVVNGVVQTQGAQNNQITNTTGVNHSAGYDPAHPLAHKIDEFGLRLPYPYLETKFAGGDNNVQARLTNQMDQVRRVPASDPRWASVEDYNKSVQNEEILYNWFCNWLNSMDWESMSEMERAQEIKKVFRECSYDDAGNADPSLVNARSPFVSVLVNKKGVCAEFAMTACALAKTLGLKSAISGTGNHAVYYIQVDGVAYMGSNEGIDLETPRDWFGWS